MRSRFRVIDISFATFLRALGAIALAWLWFRLWQWVLVFVLAAFLAVALDPAVRWLQTRGVRRSYGALLIAFCLVLVLAVFIALAGASIAEQTRVLGSRVGEFRQEVMTRIPTEMQQAGASMAPSGESLTRAARAFGGGIAGIAVALIVTVYLLLDGRRTYQWLVAFVPAPNRPRVHATAVCAREVIAAYVRGNVITSVLCAVITWIVLAALQVPAALVLALLAGIFDFVPVIGFILSAAPAVLLAFAVSPMVALVVAIFYVAVQRRGELLHPAESVRPGVAVFGSGRDCRVSGWRRTGRCAGRPDRAAPCGDVSGGGAHLVRSPGRARYGRRASPHSGGA